VQSQRTTLANTQGHTPFYPVAGGPVDSAGKAANLMVRAAYTVFRFAQHDGRVVPLRVRPFRSPNTMYGAILSLYSSTNVPNLKGGMPHSSVA
jgi:hypothetical protein